MNPWIELIVAAFVGFAFYFPFVFLSKTIEKDDIKMLTRTNVKLPGFLLRIAEKLTR